MDMDGQPDGVKDLRIVPVRCTLGWTILFWVLTVLTLGLVSFLYYWFDEYTYVWFSECELDEASHVRVVNLLTKSDEIARLRYESIKLAAHGEARVRFFFEYRYNLYYWQARQGKFATVKNKLLNKLLKNAEGYEYYRRGLDVEDREQMKVAYGRNLIDVRLVPLVELLLRELLSPFTLYQFFTVVVWFFNNYSEYACVMLVLIFLSILGSVYEQRNQNQKIRTLALHREEVWVLRRLGAGKDSVFDRLSTLEVVPGDVILVQPGAIVPCDAVLLEGSCVVDESLLTGETFPVQKAPLESHATAGFGNVLCAGTKCLSVSNRRRHRNFYNGTDKQFPVAGGGESPFEEGSNAVALVINTGFYTFKGELVRSLLLNEVDSFDFKRDSFYFLLVIFGITFSGFVFYFFLEMKRGSFGLEMIILRGLEMFATAVPPTLPLSLTISLEITMTRLKKYGISTLNLSKINEAGKVKLMCFDKTGTLTESALRFAGFTGVIRVSEEKLNLDKFRTNLATPEDSEDGDGRSVGKSHAESEREQKESNLDDLHLKEGTTRKVWEIMACCHSLAEVDGLVIGDPLEVHMFSQSGFDMIDPTEAEAEAGIIMKVHASPEFSTLLRKLDVLDEANRYRDGQARRAIEPSDPLPPAGRETCEPSDAPASDGASDGETSALLPPRRAKVAKTRALRDVSDTDNHNSFPNRLKGFELYANQIQFTLFDGDYFVLRRIEFTPQRKRFSCIIFNPVENCYELFCKGAPATVREFCDPDTIPQDFNQIVGEMSSLGLRMIGMAYKRLTKEEIVHSPELLESRLTFAGFIMFENPLKPETKPTIESLKASRVKSVMITGDHILTSISVAVASGIIDQFKTVWICDSDLGSLRWIQQKSSKKLSKEMRVREQQIFNVNFKGIDMEEYPVHVMDTDEDPIEMSMSEGLPSRGSRRSSHYSNRDGAPVYSLSQVKESLKKQSALVATTGSAFEQLKLELEPEDFQQVLRNTFVFARADPEQKADIVDCLKKDLAGQKDSKMVGYCGDGANDCPALKKAHVGLSLSQLESSMAAPFNSTLPNISNVLNLIREGKASLETGVQMFKYVCMAALVQFFGLLVVYMFDLDMSNGQYFYTDLFTYFPVILLMCLTTANPRMTHNYPQSSLMSGEILFSVLGNLAICALFFLFSYFFLLFRPGHLPIEESVCEDHLDPTATTYYPENFYVFYAVQAFTLCSSIYINRGFPFKSSWVSNRPFFAYVCIWSTMTLLVYFVYDLFNGSWFHRTVARFLRYGYYQKEIRYQFFLFVVVFIAVLVFYERVVMKWIVRAEKKRHYTNKITNR